MTDPVSIEYAGRHRIEVRPGRALRLGDGPYPLFKPPPAESVAAPDDCLDFLRRLHLSLLGVFDRAARDWLGTYFDAIVAEADSRSESLVLPAGPAIAANPHRVWCYAAHRPLVNASAPGIEAAILFWLDDGPLTVDPTGDVPVRLRGYMDGVAAPHHPFVPRPLSGLR